MTCRLIIEPDGTFNELVVHGAMVHLERLDDKLIWLHVVAANGDEYKLDLSSQTRIVAIVLQKPETAP